jgi:translation initiation factor IF-2
MRNDVSVFDGEVYSIHREKEEVREVREGMECGITLKGFEGFQIGDVIECYVMEKFGG